jgi:group I intron endonuclease
MLIYKVQNKINNKIYIEVTSKNINERIYQHLIEPRYLFGKVLKKYGIQSFDISIIDSCLLKEIAFEKEMYWIKFYNSKIPNGYNLTDGGEGRIGHQTSEETRKKMSLSLKGKPNGWLNKHHSEVSRKKMSESHKGKINGMLNKSLSEEAKKKIGLANKGKTHGKVHRGEPPPPGP